MIVHHNDGEKLDSARERPVYENWILISDLGDMRFAHITVRLSERVLLFSSC